MKTVTIYRRDTGQLLRTYTGPEPEVQVGAGEAVFDGHLPLHCCRIDVDTGKPVEFRPPSPGPDYEWDVGAKSYAMSAAALKRRTTESAIADLEKTQLRALREHAIGRGGTPAELKKRLEDIDDQITALRATLSP